jgi:hypothetical protein
MAGAGAGAGAAATTATATTAEELVEPIDSTSDNWRWFTLRDLAQRLCTGVCLGNRRRSARNFPGSFYGSEAVLWILADEKNPAANEADALQLAQALLDYGFVVRLSANRQLHDVHLTHTNETSKKRFKNNDTVYRPVKVMVSPWRLHVNIHSCATLPSKNVISKALTGDIDPYLRLVLQDDSQATKVVINTNSPTYHEHFTFGLDDPSSAQLKIRAMQYEPILEDSYLCGAQLSLYSLPVRDASEGLVDQMRKSPPYLIPLRYDPSKQAESDHATLRISMWLTKHTQPPEAMKTTTAVDCILKAFVYETKEITDGNLAALDMKIGSVLRIKWHNRVSIGVTSQSKPAYTSLVKKRHGAAVWNELIEIPVRINPMNDNVRIIVHQKAKHDLNERAISAVTIPARSVHIYDPEDGEITYPGGHFGNAAADDAGEPGTPQAPSVPATPSSLRESLYKFVGLSKAASPLTETASEQNKRTLHPKTLNLSTLAAVGSNRLVANGNIKIVYWLELKPQSNLLGDECEEALAGSEEDQHQPIDFPLHLKNTCVDSCVPAGYKRVRRAILGHGSVFLDAFYQSQGFTEVKVGPWQHEGSSTIDITDVTWDSAIGDPDFNGPLPGSVSRTIVYIMPKTAMVKANRVEQVWTLSGLSPRSFVLTQRTSTPEVPFGETFVSNTQYLCERRGANETWLGLSSEAEFLGKRPFVAGQIEGGVKSGTTDFMEALADMLKDAASGRKIEVGKKAKEGGSQGKSIALTFLAVVVVFVLFRLDMVGLIRQAPEGLRWAAMRVLLTSAERESLHMSCGTEVRVAIGT